MFLFDGLIIYKIRDKINTMERVRILGAGPAGLSAAINLARSGYNVDIFEKNEDVGSRFHGDFQGLENWSDEKDVLELFKDIHINVNFKYNPFLELKISNATKMWNFKCKRPAFYLVKRGSSEETLDTALKNQALDLGVNVHFNETIHENEADIIATGPIKDKIYAAAKGIIFNTSSQNMAVGLVNNNAALNGYSYLLIADGQGCMATVLFNKFNNISSHFKQTERIFNDKFDLDLSEISNMGGVGGFSSENVFKRGNSFYVGEAAGLQDFLWGFGIKSALTSGYLAAKSIIDGKDYQKCAEKFFEDKLKAGMVNRYLWERFCFLDYSFIVNRIHKADDHLKFLNYFYNANFIHKIIYPFAHRYLKKKYEILSI